VTFDNCTRCNEPVMNRKSGGVALVNHYKQTKVTENLCSDCSRKEGEWERLEKALEQAERSGV